MLPQWKWEVVVGQQWRRQLKKKAPRLEKTGRIHACFRACAGHSPPVVSVVGGVSEIIGTAKQRECTHLFCFGVICLALGGCKSALKFRLAFLFLCFVEFLFSFLFVFYGGR